MKKLKKPISKSAAAIEKLKASGVPVEDLTSQGGSMGFLGGVKKPSK